MFNWKKQQYNEHMPTATVTGIASTGDWFERYGIRHIAIIPDGNRRWAHNRSAPTLLGHSKGLLEVLPRLIGQLSTAGVHTITVWGFSTENWTREKSEVSYLMSIFVEFIERQALALAERYDAQVRHLGRRDRLFPEVLAAIDNIEEATKNNRSHCWNMALDYGGEDELIRAGQRMLAANTGATGGQDLVISDFLDTSGQLYPCPDVLIRSSGEKRMSGFLPLQTTYTELFFVDELFPDFTFELVEDLARQFQARKRRFGS